MSKTIAMIDTATGPKKVLLGLIGSGIRRSSSPALHMDEAAALGFALQYSLFDLDETPGGVGALGRLLDDAERAGYAGLNITHPCKQIVGEYLHELSDHAKALGAVNTVVFSKGRRFGYNTDWLGYAEAFQRELPDANLKCVLQLGCGGAGSAIAYAMLRMGAQQLDVFDLDQAKARQMAAALTDRFGPDRIRVVADIGNSMDRFSGLINATPIGMDKHPGSPLAPRLLQPSMWVSEVVYFPLETELLRAARAIGCRTVDGGGMVVFQAAEAFQLFTGVKADAERMLERFRQSILSLP